MITDFLGSRFPDAIVALATLAIIALEAVVLYVVYTRMVRFGATLLAREDTPDQDPP